MNIISNIALASITALALSGCATQLVQYQEDKNLLSLKINDEKIKNIQFNNPYYTNNLGYCIQKDFIVSESGLSKYKGLIHVQHTQLKTECTWLGLPEGFVVQSIKKYTKADSIKRIKEEKIGQYIFSKFQTNKNNKKRTTYLIEIWGANQNTFIIDTKGDLYKDIKKDL